MENYLNHLRRQAGRHLEKTATMSRLEKLQKLRGDFLGREDTEKGRMTPAPPVTLASMGGSLSTFPTTRPHYEIVLLPNRQVSPTLGIGLGGLQMRILTRRPEGVPEDSIVGKGLDNQRGPTGGGADISVDTGAPTKKPG